MLIFVSIQISLLFSGFFLIIDLHSESQKVSLTYSFFVLALLHKGSQT